MTWLQVTFKNFQLFFNGHGLHERFEAYSNSMWMYIPVGVHTNVVPQDRYNLLDNVSLSISSVEQAEMCLEVAEARPQLSVLPFTAPSEDERTFIGSFLRVLELLLGSSSKTLEKLMMMDTFTFPFTFLDFPPMTKVRMLYIGDPAAGVVQLH